VPKNGRAAFQNVDKHVQPVTRPILCIPGVYSRDEGGEGGREREREREREGAEKGEREIGRKREQRIARDGGWKLKKATRTAPSQLTELIFRCKFSARNVNNGPHGEMDFSRVIDVVRYS